MRRAPTVTVLLGTVVLDMLGLGLIVPIVPALMTSVTQDVAAAVFWSGLLGSVYGLLQFVAAPLLGRLSDRYGRRPVLLVSLTCLGVDWLAHAASPSPWTLLAFHAVAGACAGTYTVVNAYLADVTEPGRGRRRTGWSAPRSGSASSPVRSSVACSARSTYACRSSSPPRSASPTSPTAGSSCRSRVPVTRAPH